MLWSPGDRVAESEFTGDLDAGQWAGTYRVNMQTPDDNLSASLFKRMPAHLRKLWAGAHKALRLKARKEWYAQHHDEIPKRVDPHTKAPR